MVRAGRIGSLLGVRDARITNQVQRIAVEESPVRGFQGDDFGSTGHVAACPKHFVVEPGAFNVFVGNSSVRRLEADLEVLAL